MTIEEQYLLEKVGRSNPFRTPDGYFEQFAAKMTAQLPEQPQHTQKAKPVLLEKARRVALRPWLYAAACVAAVAVLGLTFLFNQPETAQPQPAIAQSVDNTFIDEAADYVMIDNMDIYACLSDN